MRKFNYFCVLPLALILAGCSNSTPSTETTTTISADTENKEVAVLRNGLRVTPPNGWDCISSEKSNVLLGYKEGESFVTTKVYLDNSDCSSSDFSKRLLKELEKETDVDSFNSGTFFSLGTEWEWNKYQTEDNIVSFFYGKFDDYFVVFESNSNTEDAFTQTQGAIFTMITTLDFSNVISDCSVVEGDRYNLSIKEFGDFKVAGNSNPHTVTLVNSNTSDSVMYSFTAKSIEELHDEQELIVDSMKDTEGIKPTIGDIESQKINGKTVKWSTLNYEYSDETVFSNTSIIIGDDVLIQVFNYSKFNPKSIKDYLNYEKVKK